MELWNYGIASVRGFCFIFTFTYFHIFTFTYFHIFTLPHFHIRPRNAGGVILPIEAFPRARLGNRPGFRNLRIFRVIRIFRNLRICHTQIGFPVAMLADVQGKRPRIHAVDARHAILFEIVIEALFAAPVTGLGQVADHEPG